MALAAPLLDTCSFKLAGDDAPDEMLRSIEEVTVEDNLNLPTVMTVVLADPALEWVDHAGLAVGTELEVLIGRGDDRERIGIGEIVALELEHAHGTSRVIVQAFDRSHRLHRGRRVRTFQQLSDGDIVGRIASDAGLQTEIDGADVQHEYLIQDNQTDYAFLAERALLTGLELSVDDETIRFRRPAPADPPIELSWDGGLLSFQVRVSAADQVSEVEVRGWDPGQKQAITSNVTDSDVAPRIGVDAGQVRSSAFGQATALVTDRPVRDTSEAESLAHAALDHVTSAIVRADGVVTGDPRLRAGAQVKVSGLGQRLSGTYDVTSTTHSIAPGTGYETQFSVRGRRRGTLVELAAGGSGAESRRLGPVIGVVTNVRDPDNLGKVRVKFPWLSDADESAWARLASPMAGPDRGLQLLPEVDDEVLVVFERGDPNRPIVVGALWNGVDATPLGGDAVSGDGAVQQRMLKTRVGHTILLDDSDSSKSIVITNSAGNKMTWDAANSKIEIASQGDLKVSSQGDLKVSATGKLTLEGMGVELSGGGGDVTIKGTQIKLN